VEHNLKRKDKTIFTDNDDGRPITLITVDDQEEEARAIAVRCAALHQQQGHGLGQMAVFYRTNAQSRVIEEEFIRRELPYVLIGGTRFYERREVKDILAYLRLLVNPRDVISFERIVNVPARKIGKKTLDLVRERCAEEGVGFHELLMQDELLERLAVGRNTRILRDFALFWRRLHRLDHANAGACIKGIIETTAIDEHYRLREPGEPGEERVSNIWELQTAAEGRSVEEFLDHVALFTSSDLKHDQGDRVVLMTLHASKGLEFPVVFICGCEQGLLPLVHKGRDCDYEEERRLMYVGITRAMQELYLSRAVLRMQYGEMKRNPPSMFLAEIPDDCIDHRDRSGRVIPPRGARPIDGPAYPQDSSANALLGGRVRGAGGKEMLERLQAGGLLQTGSALLAAVRAGDSATGSRSTRPKERSEPIVLDSDPYLPGDRINHAIFGAGEVIECKGPEANRLIVIAFGERQIKELALSFAARHLSPAGDGDDAPF
jgi:DNA helicase-2/ATP-dependent DNA helicase PcrA